MAPYEVLLGIDRAARDTGRRMSICVIGSDPLSAAIAAEKLADATLETSTEYTHAMKVTPAVASFSMAMAA